MLEESKETEVILKKLDQIQEHFYNYLFTKTVRDVSLTVKLSEKDWDYIKQLEGQKSLLFGRRNFTIEEIYDIIIPFTAFLEGANAEILPHLSSIVKLNSSRLTLSSQEKAIRNILTDNYKNNIFAFGRLILELYELAVNLDIKHNSTPHCLTNAEIKQVEESLSFIEESPIL